MGASFEGGAGSFGSGLIGAAPLKNLDKLILRRTQNLHQSLTRLRRAIRVEQVPAFAADRAVADLTEFARAAITNTLSAHVVKLPGIAVFRHRAVDVANLPAILTHRPLIAQFLLFFLGSALEQFLDSGRVPVKVFAKLLERPAQVIPVIDVLPASTRERVPGPGRQQSQDLVCRYRWFHRI